MAHKDDYIALMRSREADLVNHQHFFDSFIKLKDYNTSLRIAIANIPACENKRNKNSQAIKKAKRLANKEPVVHATTTPQPQRVKRAYTRRKLVASPSLKKREKHIDSSSLDDDTTTSSSSLSSETSSGSSRGDTSSSISSEDISSDSSSGQDVVVGKNHLTVEDHFPSLLDNK